ncbi:MAG: acriflavin resistance protein [Candidatus Sedimenticola endophacoides]|uniref:AcrB/AcrD/AcrF family protein n=2 Tax=Candidatus Sedimenticola endophacoides TaxID=2548426 RepID=A0A6N4E5G1_9GAMM|nr:MAG: acriflavin resistance protein [Candidatus Sedimenticola endophacoides]OQX36562.1 MAG: acriflavin resistance protein [Candidatus Sedimenticola endophacoides]OQX41550.1 MAG: acriflavin resistance protein [Candidatus Sedimenticola endophacoides]PUD98786.1 MAG: AcrB/AcrD/AcrF family protein [Candidatus Sedimenticola endophacoides]PUE02156.1 MAG: AcrB/AcrD/AcrF family protein [Candidatus Sedimenticola endophacoides]
MDLVKLSIHQPVSTFAAVFLVILFGIIGLGRLPIQLTPDVEAPKISVNTTWPGASPYEIEKEIIEEQKEVLKSVSGLTTMESSSYNNYGNISLTFKVGSDLSDAMMRVTNKLNEVSSYPENANRPVVSTSSAENSPVIWMMLKTLAGEPERIKTYRTFFENEVRHSLERVPGVGSLFVFGGTDKRLEITVDPARLASHGLTLNRVIERVRSANSNVSAGVLGVSKRNFRIRTTSQFQTPAEAAGVLLADDGLRRVYLGDVARVDIGYADNPPAVLHNGQPMIVVAVRKEAGANVLELTARMREVVEELNGGLLRDNGLFFDWVHDQTPYINTAIDTVQMNLLIGGILALTVLLLFLRSVSSTLTVAIAIPISVMGTFFFMYLFGRNINVISLAGITFAVGMLVDNSIVVLENIDRHRRLGKSPFQASYHGTREVWGAVLASTVTTVAVFLPVIFIEEEAGQLFRDIAIAITFSIIISLFVSVSVIPALTNRLYGLSRRGAEQPSADIHEGNRFVRLIMWFSRLTRHNGLTRIATVAGFTAAAILAAAALLPKAEYLPQGNRNLILNILIPPPGYSEEKRLEIGHYISDAVAPYLREEWKDGVPRIESIFYVASDAVTLFGGTSAHVNEARKMMPLFTRIMNSIPGMFGVSLQRGIFETGIGQGRTVDVNISGRDSERIVEAARTLFGALKQAIPAAQVRPVPSLEITYPEANLIPDRSRVAANGLSEQELGTYIDILMDGRIIGEYKPDGQKVLDLVVKSSNQEIKAPEDLLDSVIATPFGQLVRVGDLGTIDYTQGMTQIDHLERKRNIRLEVTPPEEMALQEAMELIAERLVPKLQGQGQLTGTQVRIGGNADKLTETRRALQWNFLLAIVITYLLMSALFGNYLYPLIILFSVPLAAAGGFIGLALVHHLIAPQPFDVLVMLGFIILVGTVVNNAILIVHQALNNVRHEGMAGLDAVTHSVRTRIRPIFMSTTTSLFGLLPLVLAQGSGTELYRGLGSVILGGLALSTLLTLFVVPALLSFLIAMEKPRQEGLDPGDAAK